MLSFFIASLFTEVRQLSYSTIRNYTSHVRTSWCDEGAFLSKFDKKAINRLLKGVKRLRPPNQDARLAFILPYYNLPSIFTSPVNQDQLLLKSATVFGFFGMFRHHTYTQLGLRCIVVVGKLGEEFKLCEGSLPELAYYFHDCGALGFYFQFCDKFHPSARAYFCRMDDLPKPWSFLCPVTLLINLAQHRLLQNKIFPRKLVVPKLMTKFLDFVARADKKKKSKFAPHSLRIGGHTFYSVNNMASDFIDFLARRGISRASQLYYRANSRDNIIRLRAFFSKHRNLRS